MKTGILLIHILPFLNAHTLVKRQEGGSGLDPKIREVAQNIYSFTSDGFVISLIMVTTEGVMIIDPMNLGATQKNYYP